MLNHTFYPLPIITQNGIETVQGLLSDGHDRFMKFANENISRENPYFIQTHKDFATILGIELTQTGTADLILITHELFLASALSARYPLPLVTVDMLEEFNGLDGAVISNSENTLREYNPNLAKFLESQHESNSDVAKAIPQLTALNSRCVAFRG